MFSLSIRFCSSQTKSLLLSHIRRHITYQPAVFSVSLCQKSPSSKYLSRKWGSRSDEAARFLKVSKDLSLKKISLLQRLPAGTNRCHPSVFVSSNSFFSTNEGKQPEECKPQKLSVFQKFKQMYRDYWYVLVPVHLITSLGWFGGFYYMTKSGVDVIAVLESLGISEKLINPLRDSQAGYIALAYALYKIATPVRYTVTLGGTTISIKYLKEWGYIKPIPPREKLKEMYQEKKEQYQGELKKTKDSMLRGYRDRASSKPDK